MNRTLIGGIARATATAGAADAARRLTAPAIDTSHLSGKTAVVTGAGSGIGRSLATLLAQRGAVVHAADVNGDSAVARLADRAFQDGPVHLLFNNAGIGHAGSVADTPLGDWRRLIDVNLMGVVHGLHAFLPRLLAQDGPAHIVDTASMAGLVPAAGLSAYSATKAAVVALSDALDVELAGTRVRVSALCRASSIPPSSRPPPCAASGPDGKLARWICTPGGARRRMSWPGRRWPR
ncbi:MAG TPA: SDR family NAD(P)-dependent oxidoreductase [Streptosporangiaceae bacterium]